MPKPPPSANMPTAVTATVPMRCRAATDLAITAYMAGITPGIRVAAGPARSSHRPLPLADGSRLTRRSSAVRSGTARMSASRSRWGRANGPCGVVISTIVPTSTCRWVTSCPRQFRYACTAGWAAAARATLATTKAVSDSGGSCPASSRFAVVISTSTSPYIGILRRPARMAAVTSRRLEGKDRTSARRGRSTATTRV